MLYILYYPAVIIYQ